MLRRLIRLFFSLLGLALVLFVLTSIWIIFDGMRDVGSHADVAVVPGHAGLDEDVPWAVLKARLNRAVDLYKANTFSVIIVSGAVPREGSDHQASPMVSYLEEQGVPSSAILIDEEIIDTRLMAHHWVEIMKEHQFDSIMLVTDYDQMTRLKMALKHESGTIEVEQAHVGDLQAGDAVGIVRNVFGLYAYIYRLYLVPAAEEASKDVKSEAQNAKDSINKKLDTLPK